MEPQEIALLVAAGIAMGFVNNLAGGGGLIGLTVFSLLSGLSPTAANASLRPSAVTIAISGMIGFRSKGRTIPRRAWLYGLAAAPGAVLGAILAVRLPGWVYQSALLTVVLVVGWRQLRSKSAGEGGAAPVPTPWRSAVLFTLAGLHMGFLQVAVGLMIMLALTQVLSRDLLEVNAAKMAVVLVTSTLSVATLAWHGSIAWGPALSLAVGCGIGSFLASRWSAARGHGAIRLVVLGVCALMLVRLALQLTTGG